MQEPLDPPNHPGKIWQQLPLHPQPASLESVTSYITRLTQANGLQSIAELATLAGLNHNWQSLRSFPDGSITNALGLTTLTGCTRTDLDAMTFLPLGRHFGRANSTLTLRRFLEGSLASYLRYCPLCLAEHDFLYYRLPWRFPILSGCLTHRCQFLDRCGHCNALLPHLPSSPQMATCLACHKDLRTCQPLYLSDDELRQITKRTTDLIFLLRSSMQPSEDNPRAAIGKRYTFLRQRKGLSLQEVASLMEKDPKTLLEIEYAEIQKKATFLDYLQYADLLGYSLNEIFSVTNPSPPLNENVLLAQVDEALQNRPEVGK